MLSSLILLLVNVVFASSFVLKPDDFITNKYCVFMEPDRLLHHVLPLRPSSNQLNLASRRIKRIKVSAFHSVGNLESLDLSKNDLVHLPPFVFSFLGNLKYLSLADNRIFNYRRVFVGLNNLEILDISRNSLENLDVSAFRGLGKSTNIWVANNPFQGMGHIANDRISLCIRNTIIESLNVITESGGFSGHCQEVQLADRGTMVLLRRKGITKIQKGWYRLQDTLVSALDLSQNAIERLDEMLDELPENVKSIDLSHNMIKRLRFIKNPNVRTLDLSFNKISEIADDVFQLMRLWVLSLRSNVLTTTRFVRYLPSTLTKIDLSNNHISELSAESFSHLSKLTYLNLSDNQISVIRRDSLSGLTSLKVLVLATNNLRHIESDSFANLNALLNLNIRDNALANLTEGMFNGLRSIRKINVAMNSLTEIRRDAFRDLPKTLETLHLLGNKIERIETKAFVQVPTNLLNLAGNRIMNIEEGAFQLPHLKTLQLNNNMLTKLECGSFKGLRSLKRLSLNNNGIRRIEKGWTPYMGALTHLDLSHNYFNGLMSGVFHGLSEERCYIRLSNVPISYIEKGLFDDV